MHLDQLRFQSDHLAHFVLEDDPERTAVFLATLNAPPYGEQAPTCCDNVADFLQAIRAFRADPANATSYMILHLDHDLGGQVMVDPSIENCGSEVVRALVEEGHAAYDPIAIIVHSYNIPAARWMVAALQNHGFEAVHIPYEA